jgi:hypothetical protein
MGGHQPEDGNEYENDLMLSRIKTRLLPLLLKEEVLEMNFWTTVNSAEVESAMNDIVAEIRQHRYKALSYILGTIKEAVSPNTKKQFEHLPCTQEVCNSTRRHKSACEYSEGSLLSEQDKARHNGTSM